MAFFDNRQGGQGIRAHPSAAVSADLHSQGATVDSQNHRRRRLLHRSTFTPAVGVVLAQGFTVIGRRLAQSLCHPPHPHGADGHAQQQLRQPRRQFVGRHGGQQSQPAGQRATNAPRFYAQKIQQGPPFLLARRAPVPRRRGMQPPPMRQPGHRTSIVITHGSAAMGTLRHSGAGLFGDRVDLTLQCLQHLRPVLQLHLAFQENEARRPIGEPGPERWFHRFRLRQAPLRHGPLLSLRRSVGRSMSTPLLACEHQ